MSLYQKFLDLTGLVHISEADFNAALDPKTDEQKALHGFIGWSVGKTDANPEAAAFRTEFNYKLVDAASDDHNTTDASNTEDHKANVHDAVLSSPTAPMSETVDTTHTETSPTVPTPVAVTEDHKADVHDTVSSSLTAPAATHSDAETVSSSAPDSNVVTSSETESSTGEPSTLVVK